MSLLKQDLEELNQRLQEALRVVSAENGFLQQENRRLTASLQVANAHHLLPRVDLNELGANVAQNRHRRDLKLRWATVRMRH